MYFSQATLRPSTITFVDTPALLYPFDRVPWKNDVYEALKDCDIVFLVIQAFNDSSVVQWESNSCKNCDHYPHSDDDDSDEPGAWQHVESSVAVFDVMRTHDKNVLAQLRKNATNE